jgi:hypothetical protein
MRVLLDTNIIIHREASKNLQSRYRLTLIGLIDYTLKNAASTT